MIDVKGITAQLGTLPDLVVTVTVSGYSTKYTQVVRQTCEASRCAKKSGVPAALANCGPRRPSAGARRPSGRQSRRCGLLGRAVRP